MQLSALFLLFSVHVSVRTSNLIAALPSSTKPVEFWWIFGTFQDRGFPVYSLGAIMGFHVISNYRHFCWVFLKTEAHRRRHGRMKMSVIHVRPRIQPKVHLIISVIPLHDFIVLLDLLFNVWKFALQVLAALHLLQKRRVLEERCDTKSTVIYCVMKITNHDVDEG